MDNEILIYAFRYALGRSTYATGTVQRAINENWNSMESHERQLIQREILEAKERDGLGMKEIDAPGWLAILELYA